MDAAAEFTQRHSLTLAQLPWAGDNFTAAAVYSTKLDYEREIPKRLVELTLDFEKDMAEAAVECGFGGWAYGVAGGEVHGNSAGNVYLAGVEVDERRFLIGVGEGFGRSTQAFGDIDPKAKQIVVYKSDWERLHESYQEVFKPAETRRGAQSTLYRVTTVGALDKIRLRLSTAAVASTVTLPSGPSIVRTKPHSR